MLLCTSLRCSRSASTCQTPLLSSLITTAAGYQGLGSVVAARCRIHWKLLWFLKRDISCPSTCWCSFRHSRVNNTLEDFLQNRASHVEKLLCRRWLARQPDSKISKILLSSSMEMLEDAESGGHGQVPLTLEEDCLDFETEITETNFYIIRDDLLHPLLGGNKLRKLDALLPLLEDLKATDVVTCGGSQSAHTAALACACAERGMRAHLLLRGERPSIPTGYSLLSSMYGYSSYVPRSEYADRTAMFMKYAATVAGTSGDVIWLDEPAADRKVGESSEKRVIVVREGAGDAVALLGLVRLVEYLSRPSLFGCDQPVHIVVDSGTGTTATGLALGVLLLRLPWKVTGVMLADSLEAYEAQKMRLVASFCLKYQVQAEAVQIPLSWVERRRPRKFGKILPDEIRRCQSVSRQTGVLLDPIYTLAGWEAASRLAFETKRQGLPEKVVLLHTGGTLGLFGLAQSWAMFWRLDNLTDCEIPSLRIARVTKFEVKVIAKYTTHYANFCVETFVVSEREF